MNGPSSSSPDRRPYYALAIWALLVALAVLYLSANLRIDTGLGSMLPEDTPELDELLRAGPLTRMLILAIEGGDPQQRAGASRDLARLLRADPAVETVFNGELPSLDLEREIFRYRYLLDPDAGPDLFSEAALTEALRERRAMLGMPGEAARELLRHDPTGAMLRLLDRWSRQAPAVGPAGVWEDPAGRRALLVVETGVPGAALDAQAALLDRIRTAGERHPELALEMTGYPVFAAQNRDTVRAEINRLGGLASAAVLIILVSVFRRARPVLITWLPLLAGVLAGACAVLLTLGEIHGITLAFGATLLGIAVDHPLHVLSHAGRGQSAVAAARAIWPTLAIGAATTAISYLALLWSGHPVLRQLGIFNAAGIVAATLSARFAVAPLAGPIGTDAVAPLWQRIAHLRPAPWAAPLALGIGALLLLWNPSDAPLWEDDLARLSPVDPELQRLDAELRGALGLPETGHFILVSAAGAQTVLRAEEALRPRLREAVRQGSLEGFEMASEYLPSEAEQAARRQALPGAQVLEARLRNAAERTGFRIEAFEPFISDVAATRSLATISPRELPPGPWKSRVSTLLTEREGTWRGIVTLSDPDATSLRSVLPDTIAGATVDYIDMRQTTEHIMQRLRTQAQSYLGWGLLASALLLALALRDLRRLLRVIFPVIAAMVLTAALLSLTGHPLSLFHLAALLLVAGVSVDYALFASRAAPLDPEAPRTLRSIWVCLLTTLAAFAGLVVSSLPLLHEIGLTVVLGVVIAYALVMLAGRPARTAASAP